MRTILRYALLGLVLLTVMLVSALTAMRLAIHGREVAVPRLVGLAPAEAERLALNNGLLLQIESHFFSAAVPAGRIVSQSPLPGARVRRGWRVRVAESMGPQRFTIPNVVGQSARAAELNLRRRGLELGTVAVAHLPDLPPNQIVAQSPSANASGVASPKIDLLATAPPQDQQYVMPYFVGRPLAEVARIIADAGLKLGTLRPVPNGGPPRTIVGQTPAAGQRVASGASINFDVAQ